MPRTLISFVGRGDARAGPSAMTGRAGYQQATYSFSARYQRTTSFFGWALWQYLLQQEDPPSGWLVLGTSGSTWVSLADGLTDEAYEESLEAIEAVDNGEKKETLTQEDLRALQKQLEKGLAVPELRLELIGTLAELESQQQLMSILLAALNEGDEVILDITHAFRHLPAVAAFMPMALQPLRGVRVGGMYYGAFHMRQDDGSVPVIDLGLCADYANLAAVTAEFRSTGHYRDFGHYFPEQAETMEKACFLENINNISQARGPARALARKLDSTQDDPFLAETALALREALCYTAGKSLPERMLAKSEFFLSRREYIKTVILAYEALLHATARQHSGAQTDPVYNEETRSNARDVLYRQLSGKDKTLFTNFGKLRNSMVHATPATWKGAQQALADRQSCEALLGDCLALAHRACSGALTVAKPDNR